jgi:3-oxoacyl-[acyl-carrier-protein] synthase-3
MKAIISAISHFVPPNIIPNSWFEDKLDTSDEWIRTRTGISERRFLEHGATSDLLVPCVEDILKQKNLAPEDIDVIIVATITPDNVFPACAASVQKKAGLTKAWGFDLSAACSGFLYGLQVGASLVESSAYKRVLVCGADMMSSILNPEDRSTYVLFGDGGGAVLLEPGENNDYGILDSRLYMDGRGGTNLYMIAGGSAKPTTVETAANKEHYVVQDGQSVFKAAVIGMAEVAAEIMTRNNLTADDIAWLVPHQANLRIIEATRNRMGLESDKVMINIGRYGNTTAGTIPIALSELYRDKKIKKGDKIVLASFGAGYTWGAVYLRWAID